MTLVSQLASPDESTEEMQIEGKAGSTGTHYLFVDISKSDGLNMSKRSMEIGLPDDCWNITCFH